jgi:hypothetical protein
MDRPLLRQSLLPDGIFSFEKSQFWYILEGLRMEICLLYFMAVNCILRPFLIFYDHWYVLWSFGIFSPVLVGCTKKTRAILAAVIVRGHLAAGCILILIFHRLDR